MIKLKHFRQKKSGFCGPVSLKMVLNYYNILVSANQLAKLSCVTEDEGISMTGLVKAAHYFNFQVFYKQNSAIKDLKYFMKKKIPVIVDWFLEDDGHYSVVVDVTDKNVILMDPVLGKILIYTRKRIIPIDKFFRIWFDFPGDFIKEPEELVLRLMLVVTPFKERFLIPGKYA
ncbi:MAG: cysteine peptidase family C39 domain-containing protein [Patescibacteria group bacterium]